MGEEGFCSTSQAFLKRLAKCGVKSATIEGCTTGAQSMQGTVRQVTMGNVPKNVAVSSLRCHPEQVTSKKMMEQSNNLRREPKRGTSDDMEHLSETNKLLRTSRCVGSRTITCNEAAHPVNRQENHFQRKVDMAGMWATSASASLLSSNRLTCCQYPQEVGLFKGRWWSRYGTVEA